MDNKISLLLGEFVTCDDMLKFYQRRKFEIANDIRNTMSDSQTGCYALIKVDSSAVTVKLPSPHQTAAAFLDTIEIGRIDQSFAMKGSE